VCPIPRCHDAACRGSLPAYRGPRVPEEKRRQAAAIDIGRPSRAFPVTPPGVRVRTRRFGGLWRTPSGDPRQAEGGHPFGEHRAFGRPPRRERFGLSGRRRRGFTLPHRAEDQQMVLLLLRPRWAPERRVLLATPFNPLRGPFGPSSAQGRTTMPAADFCHAIRGPHGSLSPRIGTRGRSPEVSSTPFSTRPPNLHPHRLMDKGFAIGGPLAPMRLPHIRFLYVGPCFGYRFLQTPPHGDALASRLSFSSIRMDGGLSPPRSRTCSAHLPGRLKAGLPTRAEPSHSSRGFLHPREGIEKAPDAYPPAGVKLAGGAAPVTEALQRIHPYG